MKNLLQGLLVAASLLIASAFPVKADGIFNPGSSSGGGGVTPSGTFVAGDLIAGAGTTSVQDSANCASNVCNLPNRLNITPTASSLISGLTVSQSLDGAAASGNTGFPNYWSNFINITSDDASVTTTNFVSGLTVQHSYGGTNMQGGRVNLAVYGNFTATSNASNANRNYVGGLFDVHVQATDGGTNTGAGALGAFFAINPQVIAQSGATNLKEITGGEVNIAVQTGASVSYKNVLSLVSLSTDAVQGANFDTMLAISAQPGAVGALDGILFGNMNSQYPIAAAGTIIGSTSATVTNGIDFSNLTFTGNAWKSTGATITSAGAMTGAGVTTTGNFTLSTGGTGITWTARQTLTAPAAGALQLGAGDTAAPVAQILRVQSVVAGTSNASGQNETIVGSLSTGTGTNGDIIFQTGGTGAGAAVQNSAVNALVIKGGTQSVQLPAAVTGTPSASLCLDASNNIIKKTTTGACV